MNWDIVTHLEHHAEEFKLFCDKEEIKAFDIENFKFSFKDTQFKNTDEAKEKLKQLVELIYKEPFAVNKNGKNKFAKRKIDVNGILAYAIHLEGINGEHTHPHIHFLLNKHINWGNGYYRLKQVILKHSLRLGIIPHFAEPIIKEKDFDIKGLMKKTTRFSWFIQKAKNEEFLKYIKFKQQDAVNNIKLLQQYALKTDNFSFYYKTMLNLQKRLKRQHLNLNVDGISIRDNIPVILSNLEQKAIKLIKNKNFTQKAIKQLKESRILEEYYNYCRWRDINKCYILKAIKQNTTLLPVLPRNKKFLENYEKLYKKWHLEKLQIVKENNLDEYIWKQQKTNKKAIKKEEQKHNKIDTLNIKEILKEDLLKVAKQCKNEKELREKMQELGYKEFGFKKRQNKIIGYQFIPQKEDKKIVVKCKDSIKIEEIRAILKDNYLKSKEGENLQEENIKSNIEEYKLPDKKLLPVTYIQPNQIIKLKEEKKNELQTRINHIREKIEQIRKLQHISFKKESGIRTEIVLTQAEFRKRINDEIKERIKTSGAETANRIRKYHQESEATDSKINEYNRKTEKTDRRIGRAKQFLSKTVERIRDTISRIRNKILKKLKPRNRCISR